MKIVMFGATGMVGQGAMRECLQASDVEAVLAVGRSATGVTDPKLAEIAHRDFSDFTSIADRLTGYDACFFCLGVSSVGMSEPDYRRVSYDFPLAAARVLAERNPALTFIYVTGAGTNADGRSMWARVKGAAERDLLTVTANAYGFRPGIILPTHGVRSKTRLYQAFYTAARPFYPLLSRSSAVTSTDRLGRAMLTVARSGWPTHVLENRDINAAALLGNRS